MANDSTDAACVLLLAVCLGARNAWEEAGRILLASVDRVPDQATVLLLQLSRVEGQLGRVAGQERLLKRVIGREPVGSPLRSRAEVELEALTMN